MEDGPIDNDPSAAEAKPTHKQEDGGDGRGLPRLPCHRPRPWKKGVEKIISGGCVIFALRIAPATRPHTFAMHSLQFSARKQIP